MKRTPEHVLAFVTAELGKSQFMGFLLMKKIGAEGSINEEKMRT